MVVADAIRKIFNKFLHMNVMETQTELSPWFN